MVALKPSYQLLIVDNDTLNLSLFRLELTQQGHRVTAVDNPYAAIQFCHSEPFDLIFSDIQMPDMSGIAASKIIRHNGFTGPIIALTAYLTKYEKDQILTSGINDVLIKPASRREIDHIFARWLENKPTGEFVREPTINVTRIFDIKLALERANQKTVLAQELLEILMSSLVHDQEQLSAYAEAKNLDDFRHTIHRIHGAMKFSGTSQLEAAIARLEYQVKIDINMNSKRLLAHLNNVIKEMQRLQQWYQDNPKPFD